MSLYIGRFNIRQRANGYAVYSGANLAKGGFVSQDDAIAFARGHAREPKPAPATTPLTHRGSVRYRRLDWLDTRTNTPVFGIEAKVVGYHVRYNPCSENGKPIFFATAAERDAKLKELRSK